MSGQFLERNAFWFSQFNRWQHRKAQVDEDAPILPCVFEIDFALLLRMKYITNQSVVAISHELGLLIIYFILFTAAFYAIAKSLVPALSGSAIAFSVAASVLCGRKDLIRITIPLLALLISLSVYISSSFYEVYYDGLSYHQDAILNLLQHDYSIFRNSIHGVYSSLTSYYPKLSWLFGASIIEAGGTIASTKCINYLLILAVFLIALSALDLPIAIRALISLSLALNPIALSQVHSNYVDGILGGFLTISILGMYGALRSSEENKSNGLHLILIGIIGSSSLKFTGVVFSTIFVSSLLVWITVPACKNCKINKVMASISDSSKKNSTILGAIIMAGIILLWNPYLNNIFEGKHIFYPVLGVEKDTEPDFWPNSQRVPWAQPVIKTHY